MYKKLQRKTYILLHPELGHSRWDRIINGVIITLIILNVLAVMVETVPEIHDPYAHLFRNFDTFSVIVFTIEYLLRVWSCTRDERYEHPVTGRLKYMLSAGALIDLLAIMPFYIDAFATDLDLRTLRLLRLARFLRLFRLTSYMNATTIVMNIFRNRKKELILSFVLAIFLIIISSSIIYFAEHTTQPKAFRSIPHSIYWSVITLTTTGYGDMTPHTTIGRFMTGILLLIGVAIFALPAGIITAGFLEEWRKIKHSHRLRCPHCGEMLPDDIHSDNPAHHHKGNDEKQIASEIKG
jgi:voltage-gated potassium channel